MVGEAWFLKLEFPSFTFLVTTDSAWGSRGIWDWNWDGTGYGVCMHGSEWTLDMGSGNILQGHDGSAMSLGGVLDFFGVLIWDFIVFILWREERGMGDLGMVVGGDGGIGR